MNDNLAAPGGATMKEPEGTFEAIREAWVRKKVNFQRECVTLAFRDAEWIDACLVMAARHCEAASPAPAKTAEAAPGGAAQSGPTEEHRALAKAYLTEWSARYRRHENLAIIEWDGGTTEYHLANILTRHAKSLTAPLEERITKLEAENRELARQVRELKIGFDAALTQIREAKHG